MLRGSGHFTPRPAPCHPPVGNPSRATLRDNTTRPPTPPHPRFRPAHNPATPPTTSACRTSRVPAPAASGNPWRHRARRPRHQFPLDGECLWEDWRCAVLRGAPGAIALPAPVGRTVRGCACAPSREWPAQWPLSPVRRRSGEFRDIAVVSRHIRPRAQRRRSRTPRHAPGTGCGRTRLSHRDPKDAQLDAAGVTNGTDRSALRVDGFGIRAGCSVVRIVGFGIRAGCSVVRIVGFGIRAGCFEVCVVGFGVRARCSAVRVDGLRICAGCFWTCVVGFGRCAGLPANRAVGSGIRVRCSEVRAAGSAVDAGRAAIRADTAAIRCGCARTGRPVRRRASTPALGTAVPDGAFTRRGHRARARRRYSARGPDPVWYPGSRIRRQTAAVGARGR
ncbi:Uncharacterised protein [Nocardia otitidiscaviarum]|uniref:Uncharacterized protein n=1 Tax=Nocardia otitidiscaviarum TaxID=1823 RepID=A0A378Y8I0_9NOCA|nr:Uncharacterised protein [Nocardia otitidiscaviarum]